MAVILTNIDMPKDCYKCEFSTFNNLYGSDYSNRCMFTSSIIDIPKNTKLDNCPLKSTDDMIADINQLELGGLWKPNYKEGFNDACYKIIHIINKYCKGAKHDNT